MTASPLRMLFSIAAILFLTASCGEEGPGKTGEPCSQVGENACFDNLQHLCRFKDGVKEWEANEDCGASATPNCQCVILAGSIAECTVNGNQDVNSAQQCDGELLK